MAVAKKGGKRRKSSGAKDAEAPAAPDAAEAHVEAEAEAPAKTRCQKKAAKRKGSVSAAAAAEAEEVAEENPGLLLTDLVSDGFSDVSAAAADALKRAAAGGKKKGVRARNFRQAAGTDDVADALAEDEDLAEASFASNSGAAAAAGAAAGVKLLDAITGLGVGEEYAAAPVRKRVEARPESEFHAGGIDEEVNVEDLIAPLAEAPGLGDVRKQLEGLAKSEPLPEPQSEAKRGREERSAQYEATSKNVGKWIPQIQHMRKADQVYLGGDEHQKPSSTGAMIGTFRPADDFEKELEEITKAAGATDKDVKGAKVLPVNSRIRDEKQTQQVAKLKALMFREQQSSKRVKKIKSKTYRRIHRKGEAREKEVLLERLEVENPELAKALKQEYEKKRAQQRLLRQRNARKKWTATMQRFAKGDKTAQREISKQAQNAHDEEQALRRAVRGQDPDKDSDSEAVDLSESDDDGEGNGRSLTRKTISKAKKLTLEEMKALEQDKEGELPTTGILGMNFMREAIKRKRDQAQAEARSVLQELEGMDGRLDKAEASDEDGDDSDEGEGKKTAGETSKADAESSTAAKKRKFTPEELAAARAEVDKLMDNEDGGLECEVSGPLTVRSVEKQQVPAKQAASKGAAGPTKAAAAKTLGTLPSAASATAPAAAADNPWLDFMPLDDASAGASGAADAAGADAAEEAGEAPAKGAKTTKRKKQKLKKDAEAEQEVQEHQEGSEAQDVLNAFSIDSEAAREQRNLVRTAFVEGAQMEDFEAEQEALEKEKEDKANADDTLAGWGSWTGTGVKPRKPKAKPKPAAAPSRPSKVILNESHKAEAAKYFVDQVPYPFQNPEQYNKQMQMPSGPEWNTLPMHLQKIKPKMFVKVGAIVPPLQHVKHLPTEEQRDGAIKAWASSKQPKRLKARF